MKKYLVSLLLFTLFIACNQGSVNRESIVTPNEVDPFPGNAAPFTIYEVNIRQYSPEGTLNAFTKDMQRLKDLGIGMLWIMPIQPIGMKNRKGTLGSYYSIKDYKKVNEEFGTDEDFKNLVKKAHDLGMYVILDWVPNHTAWDNPWITEHPEYYAHDDKGNITHEADWTDIALLDYSNPAARSAMIDDMKYWVQNFDIDGFRCDHAGHEIPLYFWDEATEELDKLKDLFWLAEWDEPRMHIDFDATYAWGLLHLTEGVAKGEGNANDIDNWIKNDLKEFGTKPFRLTMITNHDENSWSGTVFDRYGAGNKTFATFIFTAYGIPMIYDGQEVGLNKRLRFFDKDTIDWSDPMQLQPFYKQLIALKKDNSALWAGEYGAMPARINADSSIYAFKRIKDPDEVIGILNFSGKAQTFHLTDSSVSGEYKDYFTDKKYELSPDKPLQLGPWQYLVFVKR